MSSTWAVGTVCGQKSPAVPFDPLAQREIACELEYGTRYTCRPGPWGELGYFVLPLTLPDAIVKETIARLAKGPISWLFADRGPVEAMEFLAKVGIDPAALQAIREEGRVDTFGDQTVRIQVPVSLVEGLAPEVRREVYAELMRWPENDIYRFRYRPEALQKRARFFGLDPSLVARIEELSYSRGGQTWFSDLKLILNESPDTVTQHTLLRTLSAVDAIQLDLEIPSEGVAPEILGYWTLGGRSAEVVPFVEAVSRTRGVGSLAVTHFFPPLPRSLVNSYMAPLQNVGDNQPNCHWTTLNFHSAGTPSSRFLDFRYFEKVLQERYEPVEGVDYEFGDAVVLASEKGEIEHSCVYIADDLVLTKNGQSNFWPWVITPWSEVCWMYRDLDALETRVFRLKPTS